MSESWKMTITNVSDKIFPGLSYSKSYPVSEFNKIGNEILTSLPLQMSLYFNVIFFPFWLVTMSVMLVIKYEYLSSMYQFLLVIILIVVSLIECLRLHLGYLGNLTEKIPELAAFWMISMLLSLPLQTFPLAKLNTLPQPAEIGAQSVMLVLLIIQLISGFIALRRAAKYLASKFQEVQVEMNSEGFNGEGAQKKLE
ncbi:transmembrane protein 17-like [Ischnura elegans]|uniref:transmembrane protein 17-like n=1 Tax=Ischnura elegans TaxID=197161 RepID=UPI001ED87FB1|nr:transmembrane protein 17-like [Ischnura elegans]